MTTVDRTHVLQTAQVHLMDYSVCHHTSVPGRVAMNLPSQACNLL